MLVENLPPGNAAGRKQVGSHWQDSDYLLAEIGDTVRRLLELTRAANSKDATYRDPTPLPRPGDDKKRRAEARERRRAEVKLRSLVDQLIPPGR